MSQKCLKLKTHSLQDSTAFIEVPTTQRRIFSIKNAAKTEKRLKNLTPSRVRFLLRDWWTFNRQVRTKDKMISLYNLCNIQLHSGSSLKYSATSASILNFSMRSENLLLSILWWLIIFWIEIASDIFTTGITSTASLFIISKKFVSNSVVSSYRLSSMRQKVCRWMYFSLAAYPFND